MMKNNYLSYRLNLVCSFFLGLCLTAALAGCEPGTIEMSAEPADPVKTPAAPAAPAQPSDPAPTTPAPTTPAPTDPQPAPPAYSRKNLLFESTFEQQNALSAWQSEQAHASSIVRSSPAKTGKYSAKFVIKNSDPLVAGSYRAELKNDILPKFSERWYGFSTYLPESFRNDPVPESIFQWHNVPNFSSGETWALATRDGGVRQTPLHVQTVNGRYVLVHSLSTVPDDYRSPVKVKKYDLGPYRTGEWTDWVLHMKFTYQNDGIIEVWKNGEKVLTINGQTYYNDESGPYLKFGLYKWGWSGTGSTVSERTIHFDDFRIGSAKATYNDVAP